MVIVSFLQLLNPLLTQYIIDEIVPAKDYSELFQYSAAIFIIAVFINGFTYLNSCMMAVVGQKVIYHVRNDLYQHIQYLDVEFFDRQRTGDLMSRVTNDINTLQQLLSGGILHMLKDLLTFFVVAGYMFYANWQLATALMVTFPLMIAFTQIFRKYVRGAYKKVQESIAAVSNQLQDTLSGIRLVKAFAREEHETEKFNLQNEHNMNTTITATRYSSMYLPAIELFNTIGLLVVVGFGAWQIMQDNLTVGQIVAFLAYLRLLQNPIRQFGRIINSFQQSAAAFERITEVMEIQPKIVDRQDAVVLATVRGNIRFADVSFAYQDGPPVLEGFNLEIPSGKMIAIVGSSGAGKSTLTYLLTRFYDPTAGEIILDGHSLKDVSVQSLRQQIGVVSQEVILFNGTVKENILYGKPEATDREIEFAARAANAHDFIMQLHERYDTQVGERGIKLSGGQKQRIAIARMILKDPKIIIMDEATSALDTESERLIQDALSKLLINRTSVIIAHRLSTIKSADRIVVMEQGKIVEVGSHQELLNRNGRYKTLYELQG